MHCKHICCFITANNSWVLHQGGSNSVRSDGRQPPVRLITIYSNSYYYNYTQKWRLLVRGARHSSLFTKSKLNNAMKPRQRVSHQSLYNDDPLNILKAIKPPNRMCTYTNQYISWTERRRYFNVAGYIQSHPASTDWAPIVLIIVIEGRTHHRLCCWSCLRVERWEGGDHRAPGPLF